MSVRVEAAGCESRPSARAQLSAALVSVALCACAGEPKLPATPAFELFDIVPYDAAGYGKQADGEGGDMAPLDVAGRGSSSSSGSSSGGGSSGGKDTTTGPEPVYAFARAFGGSVDDKFAAVVRKGDDMFAAGFTASFGSGGRDALVVRTDVCGAVKWAFSYGGAGDDEAFGAAAVGGQLWLGGASTSFGSAQQAWLWRIGDDGAITISTAIGGPNDDAATAIAATTDGGAVAVGITTSYGPGAPGHDNLFVARIDAGGKLLWGRAFGGKGASNRGFAIAAFANGGGFAVAGEARSWGAGGSDFWLMRLDDGGKFHWAKTYGTNQHDELSSLVIAPDGGMFLGGYSTGLGAKGDDAVALKVNGAGAVQWLVRIGGAGDDRAHAVARAGTGYLIAGRTDSWGGDDEGLLARLGPGGDVLWTRTAGGKRNETIRAVTTLADGAVVAVGASRTVGAGQYDAWMMRSEASEGLGCVSQAVPASAITATKVKPSVGALALVPAGKMAATSATAKRSPTPKSWSTVAMCSGQKCL